MKEVYSYRIKTGANDIICQILKYPSQSQISAKIDGGVCRITVTTYTIQKNIQDQYWEKYKNDKLYQVKILGIEGVEFLMLQSLLEPLKKLVIINESYN